MNRKEHSFEIGAEKPFNIIHISDTHLTLADGRDTERKLRLAEKRKKGFPMAEKILEETKAEAEKENAVIMHTGDIIDFVSYENLERVRDFSASCDVFFCAGNHEFSLYVGEAKEDEAYRNQSLPLVQSHFPNDIRFCSRIINGVNFVALDNSYYRVEKAQLDALKKEVEKGLPVVLLVHTPFYTQELYRFIREVQGSPTGDIMSVPEEKMQGYSDHRYEQQKEDEITHEAYEYIVNEKNIRLVLTGHIHADYECVLPSGAPQLATGLDTMRVIRFS